MGNFLGKISEKYICLSSQVDVYRNLKDFKFKNYLTLDDEKKIYNLVCSQFYKLPYSDRFVFERLKSKDDVVKCFEKGAIYNDNTIYGENSYFATRDDGLCFFKINCKEHLEITGKISGVNFFRASHFAYEIEGDLEERIDFAFNTKFGYVFQDISLVGNGLKMSCLLHLPALKYHKTVDFIEKKVKSKGMNFYNLENFGICDDFYVIEYNVKNEDEFSIIRNMDKFVLEIVNLEIENRRKLFGIKTDYYRGKFEKYRNILEKQESISAYMVSKYISLCLLLQSMELIMNYDFKFLCNCLMRTRGTYFLEENFAKESLFDISKDLIGVI